MSVVVELERLREEISRFDSLPYLLTVTGAGGPHAVAVRPAWEGDELSVDVGSRTASNATERPAVSLLWPPVESGGYSLIVDGTARVMTVDGNPRVMVAPVAAVLHRPGRPAAPMTPGTSDCIPVFRS